LRVLEDRGAKRNEITLAFGFFRGGVLVEPPGGPLAPGEECFRNVFRIENPTAEDHGRRARVRWFMEAICRFVNTGGSWQAVRLIADQAEAFSGGFQADFGEHRLIASFVDPQGDIEHLFAEPRAKTGVAWVEGVTVMEVDLADRLDQIVHDGEDEGS
jgi:hypothetical protein